MRHLPHRGRPRGGKEPVADWSGAARPASQRRSLDSNPSLFPPTPPPQSPSAESRRGTTLMVRAASLKTFPQPQGIFSQEL